MIGRTTHFVARRTRALPAPPLTATLLPLFLLPLAACNSGGDDDAASGDRQAQPAAELKATVDADRFSGVVGQAFELSAVQDGTLQGALDYTWDLADAGSASGESVQATFPTPGVKTITLTITETAGAMRSSEARTVVTVLDPANPTGVFDEPIPLLVGDIDEDGELELTDGLRLSQHLSALDPFSNDAQLDLADFDRDGSVTDVDLDLLSRSILEGGTVPSAIVPAEAMPGQVMTLFSPELLDAASRFEVRVGVLPPFEPVRVAPGQLNFFLPLDVMTPGSFTENGADTTLDLLRDGSVVESFEVTVSDAPAMPGDPFRDIDRLLNDLPAFRADLLASLDGFFQSSGALELGYTAENGQVICAIFENATERLNELEAGLRPALDGLGDTEREALARVAYANGFADAFSDFENARAEGVLVGQGTLQTLCQISQAAAALDRANGQVGYLCAGLGALFLSSLGVSVLFPGALVISAQALTAFQGCASALAASEVAQLALDFVPDVDDRLILEPQGSTTIEPGETLAIQPRVRFTGLDALCEAAAGAGTGELFEELLAEPITAILIRKYPIRPVYDLVRRISPDAAEELEEVIEDVVESILATTPLASYLSDLAGDLCGNFNQAITAPVEPSLVMLTASPNVGSVGVSGDMLTYQCPMDPMMGDGSVLLTGVLPLCNGQAEGELPVTCGEEVEVTITMGDNGSLLDDIFEVVVNGQSVLTSSMPVTSISTTIPLPTGTHVLQMNGLAAPDGIGTYFIQVSGGSLENGPPTSGSNLVAGATFTWDLVVQ